MRIDTVNFEVVIARLAYVYQSGLYKLLHSANISFTHLGNESLWTVVSMVPTWAACHHLSLLPFRMWRVSPCLKVRPADGWMPSMGL